MRARHPLVSIVVPSFNQGRYIRETLDSILSQGYRPIEVLVMDGGSTDETLDVLRSYAGTAELHWTSERDRGVAHAINKGITRAIGEVIAVQSSDDVYLPGAIQAAVDALAKNDVGLVYGDVEFIDAQSRAAGRTELREFDLAEYVGKVSYIPQPAAFFRATAAREVGEWREEIPYACDAEFYLRIAERLGAFKIEGLWAQYRYHDEQRDTAGEKIIRDWARAIEPWTHHPDRRVRRFARAGIESVRHRYTTESRWIRRTMALYSAVLKNPALLRYPETRRQRDWIPARELIWKLLSRLKRMVRGPRDRR